MTDKDKELARYLAELALTNPKQVPLAMLIIANLRILRFLTGEMAKIINDAEGEFDEQLRKVFGVEDTLMKKLDEFTIKDE